MVRAKKNGGVLDLVNQFVCQSFNQVLLLSGVGVLVEGG